MLPSEHSDKLLPWTSKRKHFTRSKDNHSGSFAEECVRIGISGNVRRHEYMAFEIELLTCGFGMLSYLRLAERTVFDFHCVSLRISCLIHCFECCYFLITVTFFGIFDFTKESIHI